LELDANYSRINEVLASLTESVASADGIGQEYRPILSSDAEALSRLGIRVSGAAEALFLIAETEPAAFAAHFDISQPGCIVVLGRATGVPHLNVRMLRNDSLFLAPDLTGGICNLNDVFMRSPGQCLYWGRQATAVHACIEIEGEGCRVLVGDDCMFSSGVWLRNHDMHAIFDLESREILNRAPASITVERHVWLGQDALIVGGVRIGGGSVVGARSFVKQDVPPRVAVGGLPAKVIRENVGWSRHAYCVDAAAASFYQQ
jgi:hypothetical protein